MSTRPTHLSYMLSALILASLGTSGCTTATEEENTSSETGTSQQALDIRNPNGSYFARVTANGTGCPSGTWDAAIGPDGQTFTVRFSAYEASIYPGQVIAVKDCQLAIRLHSPQGLSYSVSELYYSGYGFLDQRGMTGRQTAKYYFQGNPLASSDGRSNLSGPMDSTYTYNDTLGIADLVWSKCGVERDLNVQTRIMLQNNREKRGTGYLNTSAVDGNITLRFRLFWRTC